MSKNEFTRQVQQDDGIYWQIIQIATAQAGREKRAAGLWERERGRELGQGPDRERKQRQATGREKGEEGWTEAQVSVGLGSKRKREGRDVF